MLAGVADEVEGPPAKHARLSTDASDVGSPDEHSNSTGQTNVASGTPCDKMTSEGNDGTQASESSPASSGVTATTKSDNQSEGHPSIPIYSQQQQIFTANNNSSYTQAGAGDANYGGQGDANANSYQSHAGYGNWQ